MSCMENWQFVAYLHSCLLNEMFTSKARSRLNINKIEGQTSEAGESRMITLLVAIWFRLRLALANPNHYDSLILISFAVLLLRKRHFIFWSRTKTSFDILLGEFYYFVLKLNVWVGKT